MPQWIHERARHIQAKNPGMDEGKAFAIATQQAHSVGKSPKGYGTAEGRRTAKNKYDTPSDDKKTADPGGIGKEASSRAVSRLAPLLDGFSDELQKLSNLSGLAHTPSPLSAARPLTALSGQVGSPTTLSQVKSTIPRNTMKSSGKYSKVHAAGVPSPVSQAQPVLSPPPVRG